MKKFSIIVVLSMAVAAFSYAQHQNDHSQHKKIDQKSEIKKEQTDSTKKKSLMKQKMEAMRDGKYNCCLQEPCDECLKAHGSCDCKKAVKNDKPVCNECYEAWQRGKGDVSGKTKKDIKKGHQHNH